jgi:hypothetical protein
MPPRGHHTAPKFDSRRPKHLKRYFEDLDYLLLKCSISSDATKKQFTIHYVDLETFDLWESLSSYSSGPYTQFVSDIFDLYPDLELKWSIPDLDALLATTLDSGIHSLDDLGSYYRSFLSITTFLCSKHMFSKTEQSRAFVRGFQPDLWSRISYRLGIKFPDHFPDDPYPLEDLYKAADYVLYGDTYKPKPVQSPAPSSPSPVDQSQSQPSPFVNTSSSITVSTRPSIIPSLSQSSNNSPTLTSFLDTFNNAIGQLFRAGQLTVPASSTSPEPSNTDTNTEPVASNMVEAYEDGQACQRNNLVTFDIVDMLEQDALTHKDRVPLIPDPRPHDRYLEDPVDPSKFVSTYVQSQESSSLVSTTTQISDTIDYEDSYHVLPSFQQPETSFDSLDISEPLYQTFELNDDGESVDDQYFGFVSRPSTPTFHISNSMPLPSDPLDRVSDHETMFPGPDYMPLPQIPQFLSFEPVTSTQVSTQTTVPPVCDFLTLVPIMFFTSYLVYFVLAFLLRTIRLSRTFKKLSFPPPYPRTPVSKSKRTICDDG